MWSWALELAGALSCPFLPCRSVDFYPGLEIENCRHSVLQVLAPQLALPTLHDAHSHLVFRLVFLGMFWHAWHVQAISYFRRKVSLKPLTWGAAGWQN